MCNDECIFDVLYFVIGTVAITCFSSQKQFPLLFRSLKKYEMIW